MSPPCMLFERPRKIVWSRNLAERAKHNSPGTKKKEFVCSLFFCLPVRAWAHFIWKEIRFRIYESTAIEYTFTLVGGKKDARNRVENFIPRFNPSGQHIYLFALQIKLPFRGSKTPEPECKYLQRFIFIFYVVSHFIRRSSIVHTRARWNFDFGI